MAVSSRIELITIGDELILGFTIDANGAFLSRELADAGLTVVRRTTVGDTAAAIGAAVGEAIERTGAVVTTGGLGPTSDDLTKPAIAQLFGRAMRLDHDILDNLRERWRARGQAGQLPVPNHQQAMIPDGAHVLTNRHGSAPGIWLEDDRGRWVAMLPGVPREMRGMWGDELLPLLRQRQAASGHVVRSQTLRTTGVAESRLAEELGDLAGGVDGLPLAYLPGPDGVDLRLTTPPMPVAEADRRLETSMSALRGRVGKWVYATGNEDLAAVVLDLCRERHFHLAVGESCTGGLLGARLTAIPGSSAVFLGGVIAYDNTAKTNALSVGEADIASFGAVSETVVRQMAEGARLAFGADLGVGITGIAGPDGGTPDKPVGTVWIALAGASGTTARRSIFIGDRNEIRYRAAQTALDTVRRALTD